MKKCVDKTYGLSYKGYLKILNEQLEIIKDCKNYRVFKKDVNSLKELRESKERNNYVFIADILLREICNYSKQELILFVNKYKSGLFNAYNFISKDRKEFEQLNKKL